MKKIALATVLVLGACQTPGVPLQPANPAVVSRIISACTMDGVFKAVGGRAILQSVPYVGIADQIAAVGVDQVCANPERFAQDIATATWVVKNIRTIIAQARARRVVAPAS